MTGPWPLRGGVLVVGECLADVAPQAPSRGADGHAVLVGRQTAQGLVARPGGSPANVAVGLARLDVVTTFAGRLSAHGLGPWLRAHLAANDVNLDLAVTAEEPATLALVTLSPEGQATYGFYGPETADWHWRPDELPSAATLGPEGLGLAAIHTGSLAAALGPGAGTVAAWLAGAREGGEVVVSFDPNVRVGLAGDFEEQRQRLVECASSAHIIKASHEDVEALFPGRSSESAAEEWARGGAVLVVVTEGAKGATVVHKDGFSVQGSPQPVAVEDTIGAGDSFTAALLARLSQLGALSPAGLAACGQAEIQEALTYALAASALTCTRPGADPPTTNELSRFLTAGYR